MRHQRAFRRPAPVAPAADRRSWAAPARGSEKWPGNPAPPGSRNRFTDGHPSPLVHQTTFHTFRVPFARGAPGHSVRVGSHRRWGICPARFFAVSGRGQILRIQPQIHQPALASISRPIRRSLRRASLIFVSNRTTLGFLPAAVREQMPGRPAQRIAARR